MVELRLIVWQAALNSLLSVTRAKPSFTGESRYCIRLPAKYCVSLPAYAERRLRLRNCSISRVDYQKTVLGSLMDG